MILVSGSSGHLGEAILRLCADRGLAARGLDRVAGAFTDVVGDIADRAVVARAMTGVTGVLHTATLHKPHVATHARQDFVDTNITGTLVLLEAAVAAGRVPFVFTSTTSVFGRALVPGPGDPAVWITDAVRPLPKNIYGATKLGAEALVELAAYRDGLPALVLRTSRFFPEADDDAGMRRGFSDQNLKVNELTHRRVDTGDAARAHLAALERAERLGFRRLILSGATPFRREDAAGLVSDPMAVLEARLPGVAARYARLGWRLGPVGRVYDAAETWAALGLTQDYGFAEALAAAEAGEPFGSALARAVGSKGYHGEAFDLPDGQPFPV